MAGQRGSGDDPDAGDVGVGDEFEQRYCDALARHYDGPTGTGLTEAYELGQAAVSGGMSIPDLVDVHTAARRSINPDAAAAFARADEFLRESLAAFQPLRRDLEAARNAAMERGLRVEYERLARVEAESLTARFRAMRDVASELSKATTRRDVARVLLRGVMAASAATVGAVVLFQPKDRRYNTLVCTPSRDRTVSRAFTAAAKAFDAMLDGEETIEVATREAIRQAIGTAAADDLAVDGLMCLPMISRGRATGVVIVGWRDDRVQFEVDRELMAAQITMGTPALERAARYDLEHDISYTLQRGMLDIPPIEVPEVPWSVHYTTSTRGLVGGDWYDVIALDDNRVGFAVGDIVGRGVEAAVSMSRVRSAVRALATCFKAPDEVLNGVDEFAAATGSGRFSSMAYVTVDRRSGDVAGAVAGHPPPLLMYPDGTFGWLTDTSNTLLGRGSRYSSAGCTIPVGTVLVLYTDGLVERRGEPIDAGFARLVDAVRRDLGDAVTSDLARRLVSRMSVRGRINDDVAVVYAEFRGPHPANRRHRAGR